METKKVFHVFKALLLISPAFFLLYLFRFQLGQLPANVLEMYTGFMFLWWLAGLWGWNFPKPLLTNWQVTALSVFLLAVTASTVHTVFVLEPEHVKVPLGIWKGWFIAPFLYYLMLSSSFRSRGDLMALIQASVGLMAMAAIVMITQFYSGIFSDVTATVDGRLVWPFLDPWTGLGASGNYPALLLSPFLALGWIAMIKSNTRLERLALFLFVLILAIAVYLTRSYGAWLGVIMACFIVSFAVSSGKRRWVVVPLITALILGGLYYNQRSSEKFQYAINFTPLQGQTSGSERLNNWKVSWDLIRQTPIWGVGPGQFQRAFESLAPLTLDRKITRSEINHALHPHNTLLMFWLSSGLFGLLTFILLILVWWFPLPRVWRALLTAPLLYLAAHGMIDVIYWKNDLAYSFWFFGALMTIANNLGFVSAQVVPGIRKGTELGFPTANLSLSIELDKEHGVYIVDVKVGKKRKRGLLYYGPRMTEGLPEGMVCEMWIFDHEGDLYGESLNFKIGSFVREPMAFESEELLKEQIKKDVLVARNKF
ncbi:MAG: riboflavin kinase [bacterium]|nr:riboflavin kinase [bacterium]